MIYTVSFFWGSLREALSSTACVTGEWENQLLKRNQIPRLNQIQKAEPTTRPVHALLGRFLQETYLPILRQ